MSKPVKVLDAGCGSYRERPAEFADATVTGLDISESGLARNDWLDEKILGDLQTYPLPANAFDVIVCNDVLEHLDRPLPAVDNMLHALKPGGELRIGVPNVLSAKGMVAKATPHSFHLFVYRRLLGKPTAGVDGNPPFPTTLRFAIRPSALRKRLERHGCDVTVRMFENSATERLRRERPWVSVLVRVIWPFGSSRESDCEIIALKRA